MINLKEVAAAIGLEAPAQKLVDMTSDSRKVNPGDLFIALNGYNFDARTKIAEVCAKGAGAVFYADTPDFKLDETLLQSKTPIIAVQDLDLKQADIASAFYACPSANLDLIGVTGTNGKSTVTQLIAQWSSMLGVKTGVMGTLGNGFYPNLTPSPNTTLLAPALEKELRLMLDAKAQAVAMEVSSHGLAQGRVRNLKFSHVAFTNLSRDHLDFHKTMENYAAAKFKLFTTTAPANAVINVSDSVGRSFYDKLPGALAYSRTKVDLPRVIYTSKIDFHARGFTLSLGGSYGEATFEFGLIGGFNVENALCAIGLMLVRGFKLEDLAKTSAKLIAVGGRMQCFGGENGPLVIVDYAHTPDGLEKALKALKEHRFGRTICLCGCGGDRDTGKRPEMAKIACEHADHVIFTDDNPRTEDPKAIIDMMIAGVPDKHNYEIVRPRETAVRLAIANAHLGDVVLLAGKGHEDYQIIGHTKHHYSDTELAAQLTGEHK